MRQATRQRRRWVVLLAALVGATVSVTTAPTPTGADEWTLRTGARLDAYSGAGQDGHQALVFSSLAFDTPAWGLNVRSAYGNSEHSPVSGPSGSFTGFTDTTLSGYYRLMVKGSEFRAGLDLDLPTGVSRLTPRQVVAVQDQDLVTLQRFGEGFDVNPTLSVYRNFGIFGLGVGVGYLFTGEYEPTTVPGDNLDPGDELTVVALGDIYATDTIRISLRTAYTYYTADRRRGADAFREGDEVEFLLTTEWRPEPWWAVFTMRDVIRFKAERLSQAGNLITDARNTNGNEFRAGLTVGYILTSTWGIQASVDVLHVDANDFPAGDPLHDGGRIKVAFGPGVTWSPSRIFGVEAWGRYFIMDVEQGPFFPRAGTIHGVHAMVVATYRF